MPSSVKAPHHKGTYHQASRALVAAAYADPNTRCARCGKTLAQHPNTKTTNRPPRWSAGHVVDGQVGGELRAEVLGCNAAAGAVIGNRSPKRKKGAAWRPPLPRFPPPRTELTWTVTPPD